MKFLCYVDRVNKMNTLLQRRVTGPPAVFARRLGISRTRLYEMLDELRAHGAPIQYNKSCQTFFYEDPFEVTVDFSARALNDQEDKYYGGGYVNGPAYFFSGRSTLTFIACNVITC